MYERFGRLRVFTSLAMIATAMVSPAFANPVGVRIYVDSWNPQHPNDNSFRTYFDDSTIISREITDAWEKSRGDATAAIQAAMVERNIGGGFRTYDPVVVLNPITDFSITPNGRNTALVQFIVPQFSIETSFRTPGPAPSGTDPRFSVSGDLVVMVYLGFGGTGKALTAKVSAFIRNVNGPSPINDSAKVIDSAADIANAMLDFVTGIDFKQTMIAVLSSQDLAKNSLQPLIEANLQTINDQYAAIPGIDLLLSRKLWADNNRLTLYVAPNPLSNVLQTGVMSGQISWDPSVVTGNCSELNIAASVQTGPPILLSSDGVTFSSAPVLSVGGFSANPIGPSACSYTLSALATGLPNALIASTSLGAANPHSSSSPYTGKLHSSTTIYPQGWSGDYVVPNAENRNYIVVSGMTAGAPIGKLKKDEAARIPNPGDERTVAPGAANQILQSPASKVEINPQPLPPKNLKPRNLGAGQ